MNFSPSDQCSIQGALTRTSPSPKDSVLTFIQRKGKRFEGLSRVFRPCTSTTRIATVDRAKHSGQQFPEAYEPREEFPEACLSKRFQTIETYVTPATCPQQRFFSKAFSSATKSRGSTPTRDCPIVRLYSSSNTWPWYLATMDLRSEDVS